MEQGHKDKVGSTQAKPETKPEGKVIWSKPHPRSVYQLAVDAMEQADDKILATAFRKLARADANGLDSLIVTSDVVEWLERVKGNIEWLIDHIENYPRPSSRHTGVCRRVATQAVRVVRRLVCAGEEYGALLQERLSPGVPPKRCARVTLSRLSL
jgi:hypothetical protein